MNHGGTGDDEAADDDDDNGDETEDGDAGVDEISTAGPSTRR